VKSLRDSEEEFNRYAEIIKWVPDTKNKKTAAVKLSEGLVCGDVLMGHASLNVIGIHTGQKPYEYLEPGEKLYKCRQYGKAFSNPKCFVNHEQSHTQERPHVKQYGKALTSMP
jgi:hypothetical protein